VATWPQATVQTCVVHLVRNSLRSASKKYWAQISRDLKQIYNAPRVEGPESEFDAFAATWEQLYPTMVGMWRRSWAEFVPFLDFPVEIRSIISRPVVAGRSGMRPFPTRCSPCRACSSGTP
jgi:transposase-like protein